MVRTHTWLWPDKCTTVIPPPCDRTIWTRIHVWSHVINRSPAVASRRQLVFKENERGGEVLAGKKSSLLGWFHFQGRKLREFWDCGHTTICVETKSYWNAENVWNPGLCTIALGRVQLAPFRLLDSVIPRTWYSSAWMKRCHLAFS